MLRLDALISASSPTGAVTLAAIIRRGAFLDSFENHINLTLVPACGVSATVDTIVQTVVQAADLTLSGASDGTVECDGISLPIELVGTPVEAVPKVPPGCDDREQPDGGGADSGGP